MNWCARSFKGTKEPNTRNVPAIMHFNDTKKTHLFLKNKGGSHHWNGFDWIRSSSVSIGNVYLMSNTAANHLAGTASSFSCHVMRMISTSTWPQNTVQADMLSVFLTEMFLVAIEVLQSSSPCPILLCNQLSLISLPSPKPHGGLLVWQQVEDESVPSGRGAGSLPAWDSHPLPSDKFDESPLPPQNPDANPVGLKQTHRCFVFQGHGTPTVMKDVTQLLTDWLEMQFVLAGCLFKVIWIHCVLVEVPFKMDWRMFN